MWLGNRQEPYHGRFYKCNKDTLKIHVACCDLIMQFVPCTKASAKAMDRGEVQMHILVVLHLSRGNPYL